MQLLVQPDDGIAPILKAITRARRTIDVHIFRLDRKKIEKALGDAIKRGVAVRTLIAHTNRGGEEALRKLELRLLGIGATVSRSADDLVRYHGKMMIVDRKKLFVLGYNFTRNDIHRSRSLGLATKKRELVDEALKLFEADFDRKPYKPGLDSFLVSPLNARKRLLRLIGSATKRLRIYGTVTDKQMLRALEERARLGVKVRIIGKVSKGHEGLKVEKYPGRRLHVRAIVRDGGAAFVGSQSLRKLELDRRREIGVISRDVMVIKQIAFIFDWDWARTKEAKKGRQRRQKETPVVGLRAVRPPETGAM